MSGFYAWQRRPESKRARRDRHLRVRIRASHEASHRHYGRPRIWKDLREEGERVSEKRVARLMRAEGLRARPRKRFRSTTMGATGPQRVTDVGIKIHTRPFVNEG
jgi:putative transposase